MVVTPFHVALATLLRMDLNSPPTSLRRVLEDVLLRELRSLDSQYTPDLVELLQRLQGALGAHGVEGEEYFEDVKQGLGTVLSSLEVPDDLLNILEALRDLVNSCTSNDIDSGQPGADASSATGLFLRHLFVSYAIMPFEALCNLLNDTQAYFNAAVAALQGEESVPDATVVAALRSRLDIDRLLSQQLDYMEQQTGRQPQGQLEQPLQEIGALTCGMSRAYLARHLSALQHKDFPASLDYLHQYFDHMANGRVGHEAAGRTGASGRQDRPLLQGASLSLGSMHAQFGHTEEALAALNETVRIAQQSSDDTCLATALASLCQIMDVTTPSTIASVGQLRGIPVAARHHAQLKQLLRRCLKRSEELQLPHLVAFALLALAKFELLYPRAHSSSTAMVSPGMASPSCSATIHVAAALHDTTHLNMTATLAATLPSTSAVSTSMPSSRVLQYAADLFGANADTFGSNAADQQAACACEVNNLAGSAHLLCSTCWELHGGRQLAHMHVLAYLDACGSVGKADDQCTALAQLAVSIAATHGHQQAAHVLALADSLFQHSESKVLQMARLTVAHEYALHKGELQDALQLAQQMAGLASPTDTTDIMVRFDAEKSLVRTLLAAGQTEAAAKAAHKLFAAATTAGQPVYCAQILLLLGKVHQQAGSPIAALPYALGCFENCRQLHLDVLGAEATLLMAKLWHELCPNECNNALLELEAVLPLILAHGSLDLQCEAQLQLAEALMASKVSADGLYTDADWVLELLEAAAAGYARLEDWRQLAHVQYQRALVLDALGLHHQRNAAAAAHHRLLAQSSVE